MNTAPLKAYAPKARTAFINAISDRAAKLGIIQDKNGLHVEPMERQGDIAILHGQSFPAKTLTLRNRLQQRMEQHGYQHTIEQIAYTWFNRFIAIRYMELHDYLEHGYRVLSHPTDKQQPEILEHAQHIDLAGLDKETVIQFKLDGTQDEKLYRLLLTAQCNALHQAMPFLFEKIDDETELLLPDNLLHSDSLIRQLVTDIPEADWANIEIIGWLYQFYISEKKDQVIGKVVASVDIPAATQLFTPNWIVKYMVQNSLGAQWLATYPQSPLKGQMEYYIEPAEQTDEVKAQLLGLTPSQLNPEELTLIDPASGSGHILVEAYELFKAIYLERGYRQRDVPQLILEKNLFGLDIDERAAQLTGFALMMKGRADDRRLFERGVTLNVMALQDSTEFEIEQLTHGVKLADYVLQPSDLTELKRLFEHATTFGSLIQVPEGLAEKLPALKQLSEVTSQDLFVSDALKRFGPLVQQAELLATQYDAVIANPPYMGTGGMNALVKKFAKDYFPDAKNDLFACFIQRSFGLAKEAGINALVTMQSWMFLSSFQRLREQILERTTISSMVHIGFNSFPTLNSKIALATAFSFRNTPTTSYLAPFVDLNSAPKAADKGQVFLASAQESTHHTVTDQLRTIPGSPIAYWLPVTAIRAYAEGENLASFVYGQPGLQTSDNDRFVRYWCEVAVNRTEFGSPDSQAAAASRRTWFPYLKGGDFRKWYGNQNHVVNWKDDGREIKDFVNARYPYLNGNIDYVIKDRGYYFKANISYTKVCLEFSARSSGEGFLFADAGSAVFPPESDYLVVLGFLGSMLANIYVKAQNATLNIQAGDVGNLPVRRRELEPSRERIEELVSDLVRISREDWTSYERSWDFQSPPILMASSDPTPTLESSYTAWITQNRDTIAEMKRLEEGNNHLFIDAYGLQDELTPDVPIERITLTVNPAYRYGGKLTDEQLWTRFRQDTMEELVSYAIGCMMGRYSLDAPGLIYAHSGNEGFDPSRYPTFPADDDGIVPLTDMEWFDDDAAHRLIEFISVAWDASDLEANLTFLADNLSSKKNESSRETLRRYLCDSFFKDHLQTYKKRPIYWLFSSGKQKAFQCLVYLHRYNEGTLARMRMEYVVPLQSLINNQIAKLDGDIAAASSTASAKKAQKERDLLSKQYTELLAFDEQLRHYADLKIKLDLDDGVKVNYGKFGPLLAEVKAVTGKK